MLNFTAGPSPACLTVSLPVYVYLTSPLPHVSSCHLPNDTSSFQCLYSLRERVLHTDSRIDITSAVELLRLHIARYVNPNYTARFVTTLETSAGAELRIEGWLAGGTGGRGDVEGVAAGGCAADAAEVGDVPGPVCAAGKDRCRCAGGENEGGDLGEHAECLGWVYAKSVGLVGVGFLSHYATRRLYRSTHCVSGDRGNIKRMSLS